MSFDLLLNDSGDLEFNGTDFVPVTTIEDSFKQRLGIRVRTDRGEWKFDTTYGVPFNSEIIGQKIAQREVDAIIQAEALRETDVDLISNFKSELNRINRSYSTEFDVTTPTGPLSIFIPSQVTDTYEYPIGVEPELSVTCDLLDLIANANEMYELLNFDLPFTGESTWYDVTQFIIDSDTVYSVTNFGIPDGGTIPWA